MYCYNKDSLISQDTIHILKCSMNNSSRKTPLFLKNFLVVLHMIIV